MIPQLILASTSRYRRELLDRLGLPYQAIPPTCDEDALKRAFPLGSDDAPRRLAEHLAAAKADSIACTHPGAVVIGSDQLAEMDGEILGKPGNLEGAATMLRRLSGRSHRLITAVCLATPAGPIAWTDIAVLTMRHLDDAAIHRIISADQPVDCAGAYKLERRGISLFSVIAAADHSAITGLPLLRLTSELAALGYTVP